jgi:transformation/transcription domain-associated protein
MRMNAAEDDGQLAPQTVNNLTRMMGNLTGPARVSLSAFSPVTATQGGEQKDYEEDFLRSKPSHYEYIRRLQQWRDKYEKYLDSRPRIQPLDLLSHYLTEFQYGKFDDIEVPGQYTEVRDLINRTCLRLMIP